MLCLLLQGQALQHQQPALRLLQQEDCLHPAGTALLQVQAESARALHRKAELCTAVTIAKAVW